MIKQQQNGYSFYSPGGQDLYMDIDAAERQMVPENYVASKKRPLP